MWRMVLIFIALRQGFGQLPETEAAWREGSDRGKQLWELGRCREAIPLLLRAKKMVGAEEVEGAATVAVNLGAAYLCLGQYTRGEQAFRDALKVLEPDRLPRIRTVILNNLGVLLTKVSNWREAREMLTEGLALAESVHGADHLMTATAANSLGVLCLQTEEYRQARDLFRRAAGIFERQLGEHVHTASTLSNLGVAQIYLKDFQDAVLHTARALELRRKLLPAKHPDLGMSLHNHAVALEKTGNRRSAKTALREARTIQTSHSAESLTGLTVDRKVLEKRR